jgi:hypothetical protein
MIPATIDRLLRKAGHPRHDGRAGLRDSPGYFAGDNIRGIVLGSREFSAEAYVLVGHDHGTGRDDTDGALRKYALTLTEAGYEAERVEVVLDLGCGEEWREPQLLVTRRQA